MTVLYSLSLVPQGDCSKNYKKEYTTLNNKEKFGSIKIILTFPSIWNVSPFLKFPIYFFSQSIYADQNYLEEFHQFPESNNTRHLTIKNS